LCVFYVHFIKLLCIFKKPELIIYSKIVFFLQQYKNISLKMFLSPSSWIKIPSFFKMESFSIMGYLLLPKLKTPTIKNCWFRSANCFFVKKDIGNKINGNNRKE